MQSGPSSAGNSNSVNQESCECAKGTCIDTVGGQVVSYCTRCAKHRSRRCFLFSRHFGEHMSSSCAIANEPFAIARAVLPPHDTSQYRSDSYMTLQRILGLSSDTKSLLDEPFFERQPLHVSASLSAHQARFASFFALSQLDSLLERNTSVFEAGAPLKNHHDVTLLRRTEHERALHGQASGAPKTRRSRWAFSRRGSTAASLATALARIAGASRSRTMRRARAVFAHPLQCEPLSDAVRQPGIRCALRLDGVDRAPARRLEIMAAVASHSRAVAHTRSQTQADQRRARGAAASS